MQQPPSTAAIEQLRERFSMFGDVPKGATIIIHKWGLFSLSYEGWAQYTWLNDALGRQRSTLRHKPLNVAPERYMGKQRQIAA